MSIMKKKQLEIRLCLQSSLDEVVDEKTEFGAVCSGVETHSLEKIRNLHFILTKATFEKFSHEWIKHDTAIIAFFCIPPPMVLAMKLLIGHRDILLTQDSSIAPSHPDWNSPVRRTVTQEDIQTFQIDSSLSAVVLCNAPL